MTAAAEEWLSREVMEHLEDYGSIGLYEFLWLLNGAEFNLTDEQALELSKRVALAVLASESLELLKLRWPNDDVVERPLPSTIIEMDEAWKEGPGKTYVAIASVN